MSADWRDVLSRFLTGDSDREQLDAARAGLSAPELEELDGLLELDASLGELFAILPVPGAAPVLERVREEPLPPASADETSREEERMMELLSLLTPPSDGLDQVLETVRAEFEAHAGGLGHVFTSSDELSLGAAADDEDEARVIPFPLSSARELVLAAGKEVLPDEEALPDEDLSDDGDLPDEEDLPGQA
jgi:hypothetical protein